MSRVQMRHLTRNHFCLDVAGITIRTLVLVTPRAVDFEAGHWRENCTGHFSVDWIRGGRSKGHALKHKRRERGGIFHFVRGGKTARAGSDKSPPIGVVWRLAKRVSAQVSSSSLNHDSKCRGPSPKALE
ncbi:hypothetical protein TNCV_4701451 [Trichonephila clavipes]|nr:hypothetical protein TNCV_4701451 [Trichonephila clavipes]